MTLWTSQESWRQWRPKKRSDLYSFAAAQSSKSLRAATSRILRPDIRGIQFHLRKRKIVTTIQCKLRRNFERLYVNSILINRTHSTMIRHINIHDILTLDVKPEFSEFQNRLSYNRIVVTVVIRYSDVTHIILSDWSSDHIAITSEQHCFPLISGWLHCVHNTLNASRTWFSFARFCDIPIFTTYTHDPRKQNKYDPCSVTQISAHAKFITPNVWFVQITLNWTYVFQMTIIQSIGNPPPHITTHFEISRVLRKTDPQSPQLLTSPYFW